MSDSEQRYQEIFEHAPVALLEGDFTEGEVRILDANRHAVRLYQAGRKEALLGSLDRTFDPASYPVFEKLLLALAAGEPCFEAETYARTLGGQRLCVRLTLTMLGGSAPRKRGILKVIDLSERKTLEDTLRRTREELQRSQEELEHFAYIASHDLQEPLRMVSSYSQLLARRYGQALDERADKYIHYVTDGAKRMQSLISDLLLLSRVETRGKPLQPTDCNEVVDDVLQSMRAALRDSQAQITRDRLPRVLADAPQLAQLFQNLIANGIKFHAETAPCVHISAERSGDEWILSVKDNGIGIEAKHLDSIFLAFRRLHERGRYPGTGIGLAIAKKIAERHGGRIWAESEPGQGATFHVSLMSA